MGDHDAGGANTRGSFWTSGDAYDRFMGRYSRALAAPFADFAGVTGGQTALDVGCGPGALTAELVARLGSDAVTACDPSPPFVAACRERLAGVDVRLGSAEALPFDDASVSRVLCQLVLHFVADPDRAAAELRRVLQPGGLVAACVWDFDEGMQLLRRFWDAAWAVDPDAPDEARTLRFGRPGEIAELFEAHDFDDVGEANVTVASTYDDFDELWAGLRAGIGPAGGYCISRPPREQARIRDELFARLGSPAGAFSLEATARCARGTAPAS